MLVELGSKQGERGARSWRWDTCEEGDERERWKRRMRHPFPNAHPATTLMPNMKTLCGGVNEGQR